MFGAVGSEGVVSNLISAKLLIKYQFISAQPPFKYATTTIRETINNNNNGSKRVIEHPQNFRKTSKTFGVVFFLYNNYASKNNNKNK